MSAPLRRLAAIVVLLALFAALGAHAAPKPSATPRGFEGAWEGAIRLGMGDLGMRVAVARVADSLAATIDIPSQGATGLPLQAVRQHGDSVHFELPAPGARGLFDGVLRADSVTGTLRQLGMVMPFVLRRPGPPAPPPPYRREEVTFPSGNIRIAGTLTRPEGAGRFPAVVLLSGSGAQNRDEEMFGFRPFHDVADFLTRRGIAVLRNDDRGVGGSTGSFATASLADFAADARAAVAFLRSRPDIDPARVGLLGHSEGGIVAPLVASQSPDVAFVVMLAGPTVRGDTLMIVQGELIGRIAGQPEWLRRENQRTQRLLFHLARTGEGREETERLVREVTRQAVGAPADSASPEQRAVIEANVRAQMALADSPWLKSFLAYDPAPAVDRLTCPLLALYAENDLQVPPSLNLPAVEALAARPGRDVTVRVIPRANHLFQPAESGSPALYGMLPKQFAPGVLDTLGAWITARTRRP